jgi:ribosomal protein S18 acetylase RimI-like enzyme
MTNIQPACFPDDLELVRTLFREYAASLHIDLSFQDFEAELAALPGKFAPPRGQILLARNSNSNSGNSTGAAIGCIALRPWSDSICEMKRLYVRPAGRGQQLGRQLATQICHSARAAGYTAIRLDTLPSMQAAQQLYTSLGFKPIAAYTYNPIEGALFMECDLTEPPWTADA